MRLVGTFFLPIFLLAAGGAGAQALPPAPLTGYAVITPQGGSAGAFTVVETLTSTGSIGLSQSSIGSSTLLTATVFPANAGATGIVILNASATPATVNLSFTTPRGDEVLNRTIQIAERRQISQFLREFFTSPAEFAALSTGLLTITSNIPIAVLAMEFRDLGFTAIPTVPSGSPLPTPGIAAGASTTVTRTPTIGIAPTGSIGTFSGSPLRPPVTTALPSPVTIGGSSAMIFPQVVIGGGWSTTFSIGNITTVTQAVRIDLFTSDGTLVRTLTDVAVPPRGLVVFSPESGSIFVPQ